MTIPNWEQTRDAQRARINDIAARLSEGWGVDRWDLPLEDGRPDWARRFGDFEHPGPSYDADEAWWLVTLGVWRMVAASQGDLGPKIRRLSGLDSSEVALDVIAPGETGEELRSELRQALAKGAPFFSEAVLYPLVGKEMARSILASLAAVAAAAGQSA